MSMDGSRPEIPSDVEEEFDAMFERMQTPEARAGVEALFNASPEELQALIAKSRIREATFDGTLKATIDEAVGDHDPDITYP